VSTKHWLWGTVAAVSILMVGQAWPARESNVRATKHNFSNALDASAVPGRPGTTVPTRTVKATAETQVCVFCHTPHAATAGVSPLWNRKLSNATYTVYTSSSLDAQAIGGTLAQPGGSSKLCLSCHDGTLAIGSVNVLNGAGSVTTTGTQSITMTGTGPGGVMAPGSGTTTGYTRFLDTDLTNDHPISVSYNKTLVDRDGELRTATQNATDATWEIVSGGTRIAGVRNYQSQGGAGQPAKPLLPFEKTGTDPLSGQVQCASCHDPHMRETNEATVGNQKFLRLNRFQEGTPTATWNQTNDIICLSCHDKNQGTGEWAYSAHANPLVATETYNSAIAGVSQREFPASQPVWKAACLNCHDTHTVPGARRLLREGTDSTSTPKAGGSSAIEETCYQCHTTAAASIVTPTTTVPDIKTDFTTLARHMPITSASQPAGTEKHDIGGNFSDPTFVDCSTTTNKCGKDFIEQRTLLGVSAAVNRHAECTDCHNPHRVVKFKDFRGAAGAGVISGTPDASGTHPHRDTTLHTNIASGVLRGSWGVEPIYTSTSFHVQPSGYTVKRGDPGNSSDSSAGATYVTREYQICLKCHSDYGYSDNNAYPTGNRPDLGSFTGGTPSGTNLLTQYTNQAKEMQPAVGHTGEPQGVATSGAGAAYQGGTQYNHRSWHPAIAQTGRTIALRGIKSGNPWLVPWSNQIGSNTLYCTDCHGSDATNGVRPANNGTDAAPTEDGSPWGPHGSSNDFLLKGGWNSSTGNANTTDLCFKCHNASVYRSTTESGDGTSSTTGFSGPKADNLHGLHGNRIGKVIKCTWCHVAVPHGWKNKALLVNMNDIGDEAGYVGQSYEVATSSNSNVYNKQPYYLNAKLKVVSFAQSNKWADTNCGSSGKTGLNLITNNVTGTIKDTGATGTSNTTGTGKNWMTSTCKSPP